MVEVELLHKKENNPQYYKDIESKLLLLKENNNLILSRENQQQFLSFFENILTSKKRIDVYMFFLEHGASTVREISESKKGSYTYYYRIIKDLLDARLIEAKHRIKSTQKRGGAPATVYGLIDCTENEIMGATSRYLKSLTPLYSTIEVLYQRTLTEIIDEQIQYRKIVNIAVSSRVARNRFHHIDIANEIAYRLQESGVKVWR